MKTKTEITCNMLGALRRGFAIMAASIGLVCLNAAAAAICCCRRLLEVAPPAATAIAAAAAAAATFCVAAELEAILAVFEAGRLCAADLLCWCSKALKTIILHSRNVWESVKKSCRAGSSSPQSTYIEKDAVLELLCHCFASTNRLFSNFNLCRKLYHWQRKKSRITKKVSINVYSTFAVSDNSNL